MNRLKIAIYIFLALTFSINSCTNNRSTNQPANQLSKFVNPFIGTGGHGHTFPGATVPHGLVQLSPDTRLTGWDGCSGYHYSDSIIYGFSHTHLSGTGVPDYGDILFMPGIGEILFNNGADGNPGYHSKFRKKTEKATAGFYSVHLDDCDVDVELSATQRAGFHKYTFHKKDNAHLILDLEHRDKVLDAGLRIVNGNEIEGYRISKAWAQEQHVYFVAKFSQAIASFQIENDTREIVKNTDLFQNAKIKAALNFNLEHELLVKVGISAVDIDGARKNLEAEIPHWDFEKTKNEAETAWNSYLSKIVADFETEDEKTVFYTALYHSAIAPNIFNDVDKRYRGTDLKIHTANDYEHYTVFSLWDTYRATHPLYTLIEQKQTGDYIRTFLSQYKEGGKLPMWELAGNYTGCMIGYHAIPVIADAYLKGIRDFDEKLALEAMIERAEANELGKDFYRKQGFLNSEDESESVSKTLEYAYDDWCIAEMAKAMGEEEVHKKYIARAQNYKNLLDPETKLMRGKNSYQWNPNFAASEVNFNFTEANSWQYSFYVPQDLEGFAALHGGREQLEKKLDALFAASSETIGRDQKDISGMIGQYAHGNEPSHHIAYLYNFTGQPWKTQALVNKILTQLYQNAPDGLSGNEDCGQMSSWYVLSALGFYPVTPGSDEYVFGSPKVKNATINLENGKRFEIQTENLSSENFYIQNIQLNGKEYPKNFIKHEDIVRGGKLVFQMGNKPAKDRGVDMASFPSSSIDSKYKIVPVPAIRRGNHSFFMRDTITLDHPEKNTAIYFTLDGTEPVTPMDVASDATAKISEKFNRLILIDSTVKLKAVAYQKEVGKSNTIEAIFKKIPKNRKLKLGTKYANYYAAGGDNALIDYIRGSNDFRTNVWQGYHGLDLDAIIDLGKKEMINKLGIGFLQDENFWIFMPLEVEFFSSSDGKNFRPIGKIVNDISPKEQGGIVKDFEIFPAIKTRYIRIKAKNRAVCPSFHKGAGEKAWIFADEIVIE